MMGNDTLRRGLQAEPPHLKAAPYCLSQSASLSRAQSRTRNPHPILVITREKRESAILNLTLNFDFDFPSRAQKTPALANRVSSAYSLRLTAALTTL